MSKMTFLCKTVVTDYSCAKFHEIHVFFMMILVFFDKTTEVSDVLNFWKHFLIFELGLQLSTSVQNFTVIRSLATKVHGGHPLP